MSDNNNISNNISTKIYTIRGVQVMLDSDLAEIYGYTTKAFNQQVKNNIDKFPEDMMFSLTNNEITYLRSKNLTSSWGGTRYYPHAFTEQGIYMLMTVLKGELATKQSLALVRIFKQMKDYLADNAQLFQTIYVTRFTPSAAFRSCSIPTWRKSTDIQQKHSISR